MKILVTGAAGFIGSTTAKKLLERGDTVVGLDNFNDYYDVSLKEARAAILDEFDQFSMVRIDLADRDSMDALFAKEKFDKVVHLAAQAGVRYSIENPHAYIDSNIVGTLHILEGCVTIRSSTWSTRHPVPSTARTQRCRSRYTKTSTIRSLYTVPRKKPTS